ncbi:MAG TPA: cell surface protein SprA [Gemmatimonadaceae bacterium]|nr:cell surface protein SprA [Gemmatimonadaceae bacterium]
MKYTVRSRVSDTQTTSSAHPTEQRGWFLTLTFTVVLMLAGISSTAHAQDPRDTTRVNPPAQPVSPPTGTPGTPGIRLRLGRDTLPLTLPSILAIGDRESFRQAQAQIEAARATAFQQNMRTILEAVWGQVATSNFATSVASPSYPGDLPPKPKPPVPNKVPIFGEYADLGLQLDGRLEFRAEKNQSALCSSPFFFDPSANCRSAFEPLVDFQFAAKSGGTVADRVHVNLDYDTQREFDASNNISVYYEGKGNDLIQRLEIGNVTFQPPASRYITAGIPSGNYGIQGVMKLGSMRLKTIFAQQKGNIVRDRVFTVGDRTLQAIDRKIEDYQFEPRRFFFTIDPRLFGNAYPNVDILDTRRMAALSASLPDTLRPTKIFLYRLLIGGQPPNPSGPQFRLLGDPRSRRGQVYEYLREGVDYYADPSLLWIALVRPLSLNNERLVIAYRVRINGRDTTYTSTGGTPDLTFTPAHEQFANLIWDPDVQPGQPAFDREIRSVYRIGGSDVRRQSVTLKVVTGSSEDQEKPVAGGADTYLKLFGLAQATNSSTFDLENRLWPRPSDPNFELSLGAPGARTIRDQFLVFPSAKPFASTGLAKGGNPANDTIYTTPPEYVRSSQRPEAVYHIRVRYQAEGSGDAGALMLGTVQVRPNSERLLVDGIPLTRGTDYSVDYDLGRVSFNRPDTLFPRPRQVTVQYEENPVFEETPTSIFGATAELPLDNGEINFTAISQSQRTNFTRPPLGFEPSASLVAGMSALFSFDAAPLTTLVSKLPFGSTSAPSRIGFSAEIAASRPETNASQQAYLESFEGEGGLAIALSDPQWYFSSQPALGTRLSTLFGKGLFDLARAATLAWQTNGVDANHKVLRYRIDQIDTLVSQAGAGIAGPEQLLWLTLYPLSIGGQVDAAGTGFRWTIGNTLTGRRWRSIRTALGASGTDISHAENLEFWAQIPIADVSKNPTLVFDFGDISENSVTFGPDTLFVTAGATPGSLDTTYRGRRIQGLDTLNSERDPFSRAFNAGINDTGLAGDVVDTLIVVYDTLPGVRKIDTVYSARTCRGGFGVLQLIGDTRTNCTVSNNRLDDEDIDADNVLNLTTAERSQEQWRRYVVNLADRQKWTRIGKCGEPPQLAGQPRLPRDNVCWVLFRVPFNAPDDSLGNPLLRRARALRITMISGDALGDSEFSTVPLARLRLTGAPWLKVGDRTLRGIAGTQATFGTVQSGVIGTQDVNPRNGGVSYVSPPGVTDAPTSKTVAYQPGRVQVNERSLRLLATDLAPLDRAEAYYRFPEGEKNFMSYKELRVWARGVNSGWGPNGELEFYIKIARDDNNFYMYRTTLNFGVGQPAWLPEIKVDFSRLFTLRAQIQNAYLQGKQRNTCSGVDSILIANTPLPAGIPASARYAACADGYIVYTIDPGSSPPNLAAVQELAVGMVRLPAGTGANPINPADTLEMWVDDIRLAGVVNQTGFAGQTGLTIVASDFADIRINASRKDPNFRQLAEQPTFLTDNSLNFSSAFHLEKLLPASLNLSIPFTVNYTSASVDPFYVSQTDIQADAVDGLRTPRSAATSVTLSVRRTKPLTGSFWAPILNNLALNSSFTKGASRSEYEDGNARNFVVGLDFNLSRALMPGLARWSPTDLHLTSAYTNGYDNRVSFLKPAIALDDTARPVKGLTRTWQNGSSLVFHPFKAASVRWDITSVRDLRGYGSDSQLGLVASGDRDRVLGYDTGLERERAMQAGINISPPISAWFRPRLDFGTSYNMLRDPNTLSFTRDPDSTGNLRIPRRLGNSQTTTAGLTLDLPRAIKLHTDSASFLRGFLSGLQPLDINFNRSVLSVYDGSAAPASLGYQFGIGGINTFRELGGQLATSVGVVTQLSLNHSINLPLGASIATRYQRINTRNWTRRFDEGQEVADGTQVVFPDFSLRWSGRPAGLSGLISSVGANARVLETRQFNGTQPLFGEISDDTGELRVRSYPVSGSLVFAGARPVSTTVGFSLSKRLDAKPGLSRNGDNSDFSIDLAKPWKLPAEWNARSDLRTRLSYQKSQGQDFVVNPLALTGESRLSDNGRRAFSMSADTDVAENLSSSFVLSRVESFDRNLNRHFTQTVLSAVMHLQFYAGEFK